MQRRTAPAVEGMGIGIELAACVLVGYGIGWLIDRKVGTETAWFTLLFVLLGTAAGLRRVFRLAMRIGEENEQRPPSNRA